MTPTEGAGASLDSGLTDSNDHGTVTMNTAFTGNINLPNDKTGRGTFNFGSANFAWYYVDDTNFIAIETDQVAAANR